jgi:hypothetical protein
VRDEKKSNVSRLKALECQVWLCCSLLRGGGVDRGFVLSCGDLHSEDDDKVKTKSPDHLLVRTRISKDAMVCKWCC